MRKIICIIILSCLLIDLAGSWLMYSLFRQSAKDSMQTFIQSTYSTNDKINFLITPKNTVLFELNDDDEISFQGVLYDIINKKQVADTLHVTCLMDNNETVLVNNYNNAYFNCLQKKEHGSINPFHLFYSIYEIPILKVQLQFPILLRLQPFGFMHCCLYKTVFSVVKPPPKVVA